VGGDSTPGLATGAFLLLVGVWVVSRTIVHDSQGKNLVDRIIEYASGGAGGGSGKGGGVLDKGVNVGPVHIPSPLDELNPLNKLDPTKQVRPPIQPSGKGVTVHPFPIGPVDPSIRIPLPFKVPNPADLLP
jgi:hypothetical protein